MITRRHTFTLSLFSFQEKVATSDNFDAVFNGYITGAHQLTGDSPCGRKLSHLASRVVEENKMVSPFRQTVYMSRH